MSMAMAYVSMYNNSDDDDISSVSDYDFTPTPPNRQKVRVGSTHLGSSPTPCQKLVYSPPSESADFDRHDDNSVLYTTAVDESLVLQKPAGKVGGVSGLISEDSPLNSTYIVNGVRSRYGNKSENRDVDKQVDQLCDSVANLSTSTRQTGQTSSVCRTPSPLECSFAADIEVTVPETLTGLTDSQLRERLVELGEIPGPITPSTKIAYLMYLAKLERGVQPTGNKGYKGEGERGGGEERESGDRGREK